MAVFPKAIVSEANWLDLIATNLNRFRDKPVRIIWALKDPAFGKEKYIEKWLTYFPRAEVERLPEDHSEPIIKAIKSLL